MNMRMKGQIASPGMEYTHQADLTSNEARVARQLLGSFRRSAKESGVKELLISAGKDA